MNILGKGSKTTGKAMLQVMEALRVMTAARALEANVDDTFVYAEEFQRLYLASNILAAKEAVQHGIRPSYLSAVCVVIFTMTSICFSPSESVSHAPPLWFAGEKRF